MEAVIANLRQADARVTRAGTQTVDDAEGETLVYARLDASLQRFTMRQLVWWKNGRGWVLGIASAPDADTERSAAGILLTMATCIRTE